MSESMDKYYKDLVAGKGSGPGGLIAAAAGAKAVKEAFQKKAKGGVVRKMKKGGKVK